MDWMAAFHMGLTTQATQDTVWAAGYMVTVVAAIAVADHRAIDSGRYTSQAPPVYAHSAAHIFPVRCTPTV